MIAGDAVPERVFSTAADVEAVLRQLPRIVARRRALAPLGHR